MTATRWAIPDGEEMDIGGRKFAQGEEGAPMLCNMFCQGQPRVSYSPLPTINLVDDK